MKFNPEKFKQLLDAQIVSNDGDLWICQMQPWYKNVERAMKEYEAYDAEMQTVGSHRSRK